MERHLFGSAAIALGLVFALGCSGKLDDLSDDSTQQSALNGDTTPGEAKGETSANDAIVNPCKDEPPSTGGKPPFPGKKDPGTEPQNPGEKEPGNAGAAGTEPSKANVTVPDDAKKPPQPGKPPIPCDPGKPPPPAAEACTWSQIGNGNSCIAYADLKAKAIAICESFKAVPRSIYPAGECSGGASIAKLECCAPDANGGKPPPPPKPDPGVPPKK